MNWILEMDNLILDFVVERLHGPVGDAIFPVITALGDAGIFWILLAVVLLLLPKWRKAGMQMLVALALGFLIGNLILKPLIARERPFAANGFLNLLIAAPKDFSFPSGHTTASFAAAAALFWHHKPTGATALVLAALIAFSRIYLYVHYPSDILGGIILAVVCAVVSCIAIGALCRKFPKICPGAESIRC